MRSVARNKVNGQQFGGLNWGYLCQQCSGLGTVEAPTYPIDGHWDFCKICEGTGRDTMPWAELLGA